LKARIDVNKCS